MTNVTDAVLVKRARMLAGEMAQFLEARDMPAPSLHSNRSLSNEERRATWNRQTDATIRHGSELHTTYAAEYAERETALLEGFAARGVQPIDPSVRSNLEHPTNPIGVREVMRELGYMAEKLELMADA